MATGPSVRITLPAVLISTFIGSLNGYVLAQSVCAPLAGWYADRTSVRFALATSIAFGLAILGVTAPAEMR